MGWFVPSPCPTCHGSGEDLRKRPCKTCKGKGNVTTGELRRSTGKK